MRKLAPEFVFTEEQLYKIIQLAKECGLCEETVKILYARGFRDRDSINEFMHPSHLHFISPFKMQGMQEAVELITLARDEGWEVLVYGDYDADGICAATIMRRVLRDFGIEPIVCVPERKNGYGLSKQAIDDIFEEHYPQLFITVDCGISCAEEIEYIKEQGAEVIVTDHHELPDKIPDCICINPKFNDGYIYDNLCGAGVAFKVGCALNGDTAHQYLDYAAIATVADSVPLIGENRDIVFEGLQLINKRPKKNYAPFLSGSDVTSQTISYTLAPKINAAGRMGDAKAALELFDLDDEVKIHDYVVKLTAYNTERQVSCDELYLSAKKLIKESGEIGRVIMLSDESWNSGFVGIVAARLVEEYSRPCILFVRNGDTLKGSARSVESVNIYEALKACSKYISEFGGHAQAAGVNVSSENFEKLKEELEKYLQKHYSSEDFVSTLIYSGTLVGEMSYKFAKELEMLEPFGVGNRRPLFIAEGNEMRVRPLKQYSNHISVKCQGNDLTFFNGTRYSRLLESPATKQLVFDYNISHFKGKEYTNAYVRDVIYDKSAVRAAAQSAAEYLIFLFNYPESDCEKEMVTPAQIDKMINECDEYGTAFIAHEFHTLKLFKNITKIPAEVFVPNSKSCASILLFSPSVEVDLSKYSKVVFLDLPIGIRYSSLDGKKVYVCSEQLPSRAIAALSTDRADMLTVYSQISANANILSGIDIVEMSKNANFTLGTLQTVFAFTVFMELSIVSITDGKVVVYRGVKSQLENSDTYSTVLRLKG